jgi:hypothetical protein
MLWSITLLLFITWILLFGVFHVASASIHILLVLALVSLIGHFVAAHRTV